MKKIIVLLFVLMSHFMVFSMPKDRIEDLAETILNHFVNREFDEMILYFDETLKEALPEQRLDQVHTGLVKMAGPFKKQLETTTTNEQGFRVVYILCRHANKNLKMKAVFNQQDQLSGLFFLPENHRQVIKK